MVRERWSVRLNGAERTIDVDVEVVADLVDLWCYCGVPCGGIYRFWYRLNGRLMAVTVDRQTLRDLLDELVLTTGPDGYPALPSLVREYNEHRGWTAAAFGAEVGTDAFAELVSALRGAPGAVNAEALLAAFDRLVADARSVGSPIWMMDD